jgi:hypothetical protein
MRFAGTPAEAYSRYETVADPSASCGASDRSPEQRRAGRALGTVSVQVELGPKTREVSEECIRGVHP